ncbi:hypothetical protein O181_087758 [Austropuccinia psidii MF-1]|uniref:Uncharacterized protein n=1 Tax=Austropuccinia psidii MF-1 TaxID=1389203 RepID=A0A9Q3P1P1_9BASI|nr:hypothetical protein [Austropuccinia psidii MF-1]
MTTPFIANLIHNDNNKVLMKEAPQLKEWQTCTGEGEFDHMSFIKTIEMLQEDYVIPDELIAEILHSFLEKSATRWYYGIRKTNGKNTCSLWKNEIITKWENDSWRYKIENAFQNSSFDPEKHKTSTLFLKQVEILNSLYAEISESIVHMIIPKKCGELEHSLRSRCKNPFTKKEYINELEDLVTRTKIGRTRKKLDIKIPHKRFIKKDKPIEPSKPNTPNTNEQENAINAVGLDT